jgi:Protein of unknown function (DUF3108)
MKIFIVLFSLIAGFSLMSMTIEENNDCKINNTAFKGGEEIVYKAYYNWEFVWIPAGEAVFNIRENADTYEITVVGKTYKSYDVFFKVNDYFHSVIDKKTMFPKSFVRIVEEGNYRKFDSLVFNQETRMAISYNGRTKATAKRKIVKIENCTHDLLSVLYFMRNIDVSKYNDGDHIPTRILFDETLYPIKVRYEGKQKNREIKGLGTFNTIKVIPDLVTGNIFKDGNKMQVWATDDQNKLPLLIESPLSVGSAKAILKSYKGIRNPLSSQKQ